MSFCFLFYACLILLLVLRLLYLIVLSIFSFFVCLFLLFVCPCSVLPESSRFGSFRAPADPDLDARVRLGKWPRDIGAAARGWRRCVVRITFFTVFRSLSYLCFVCACECRFVFYGLSTSVAYCFRFLSFCEGGWWL